MAHKIIEKRTNGYHSKTINLQNNPILWKGRVIYANVKARNLPEVYRRMSRLYGMLRHVRVRVPQEPQHKGHEPLHADVHGLCRHVHGRRPHDGQGQRLREDGLRDVRKDVRHVRDRMRQVQHGRVQDVR